MGDFVSKKFIDNYSIKVEPLREKWNVRVASGDTQSVDGVT